MDQRFKDKVVWITGGGTGIGRASAREFARQGAHVVVSGRRNDRLQQVVAELTSRGLQASAVACDVADDAQIAAAVDAIITQRGRLDVALANAGFAVSGRVEQLTAEDWRRQFDTNVVGAALTAKYALPHLKKVGGRVALVGSVMAFICLPKSGAYAASKAALRAIGQTLSIELQGSGVSCTLIHPGLVESDIALADNLGRFDPSKKDRRPKLLMWSSEAAAKVMVDAVHQRQRQLVFTRHGRLTAFVGQHFPGVAQWVARTGMVNMGRQPRRTPH